MALYVRQLKKKNLRSSKNVKSISTNMMIGSLKVQSRWDGVGTNLSNQVKIRSIRILHQRRAILLIRLNEKLNNRHRLTKVVFLNMLNLMTHHPPELSTINVNTKLQFVKYNIAK